MNASPSQNEVRRNDDLPAVLRFKEIVRDVIDEQQKLNQDTSSTLATRILEREHDIVFVDPDTWHLATHDFREDVVWIVVSVKGHCG